MHEAETFVVEASFAPLPGQERSLSHNSDKEKHFNVPEKVQLQPERQGGRPTAPMADQNVSLEVSRRNEAPVSTSLQAAQQTTPANGVLNAAPVSSLRVRPQEESTGSQFSSPSRQYSGTMHVMSLEESGSPRFIHKEPPLYPFMARRLGKEGKALLRLILDAKGLLQGIEIVETDGFGFAEAACTAIRKSTFAPAVRNDRAISSQVLVPVKFVLHEDQ
jgi:periplasmic protein TonB